MRNSRALPIVIAAAGFGAVVVGIYQGLVHVAPGYEGTIVTGWGRGLNHEEYLLAQLSAVGVGGAVGSLRWRRLAAVPVAAGGVVSFYSLRAVLHYAFDPGLYTEVSRHGGGSVVLVLGAEPFLLVAGGVLLAVGGVMGWRARLTRSDDVSPVRATAK